MRFRGKSVLVTGAASGIGRAIAIRFAQEGAHVAINYRKEPPDQTLEACRQVQQAAGASGTLLPVQADVSREAEVDRMVGDTVGELGRLDILINNAGIQTREVSHKLATEDFDRVIGVNLRGAFFCCRASIRHFISRDGGGVIVNNSSVHEIIPKPQYLAYSISKGGLENLTRTLALEYAHAGIRVNSVGPGAIVTPINEAWIHDEDARRNVESHIPMGRAGTPNEIATVFAFLASDEASYITGQTLYACGGLTLFPEFRGAWSSAGE